MSVQSNWTWFLLALVPAVASQIVRMGQTDPVAWIACDYAGRLGTLAVLAAIPTARSVAFARETREVSWPELAIWVVCLLAFELIIARSIAWIIDAVIPGTRLTAASGPTDWLYAVDVTFGTALVAYQEEIVFRRCARAVLSRKLGNGIMMVIASALLFGSYHWSRGLGTIISAILFGIVAMTCYLRAGVLWPLVLVHYVTDVVWW
jgi:membrane protease YdiL (CAAX protease family)